MFMFIKLLTLFYLFILLFPLCTISVNLTYQMAGLLEPEQSLLRYQMPTELDLFANL